MGHRDKKIYPEENMSTLSLGVLLRRLREEKGLTLTCMADRSGYSKSYLSSAEDGSRPVSKGLMKSYERYLGLKEGEINTLFQAQNGTRTSKSQAGPQPFLSYWNIPIMRNLFFTGREDLLALLHERFSTRGATALARAQALYGLGGIGKTQMAAEYVFRYGEEYTQVLWIQAASRETLVADFVQLAEQLELADHEEQDQSRVITAVKRWLAAHEGWLLVLDNADDLPLAQTFLPGKHRGSILFTTRAAAAGGFATAVEVEQLTPQEGTLLLLRQTKHLGMEAPLEQAAPAERAAAERIVEQMDGLPLALVQAGAYMEETGCPLADYLCLYAAHRKDLLARHSRLMLDYPDTVDTTWSLAFEKVEQESPAAAEVLRYCAFLAPDAIPEALLMGGVAQLGGMLGAGIVDAYALNEALEVLRRYSLVQRDGNAYTLRIHRLVQAVLRESMDEPTRRAWAERTVRAVNAAFPEVEHDPSKNLQAYLPHVQECAALISQYHLYFSEAARLLYQAADFLYIHGFHPQSHAFHEQALAIREQVLDAEDPAMAESLNALAILARLEGTYGRAEAFHRRALTIREIALGPHHPATAQSLNNLSVLYRSQGKYEQAELLLKRALTISDLSLGSEHPDTLFTFTNLAKLYFEQRKYEQAEQLLRQTLAAAERVLAPEDPFLAHNLNLLGRLAYEQGDYVRAEPLWRRALAILERTLGPEHPATAGVLNDLADLCLAQGCSTQAQSLCQRAVSICERRLGPEHPDTIAYRQHLARIVSKKEVSRTTLL